MGAIDWTRISSYIVRYLVSLLANMREYKVRANWLSHLQWSITWPTSSKYFFFPCKALTVRSASVSMIPSSSPHCITQDRASFTPMLSASRIESGRGKDMTFVSMNVPTWSLLTILIEKVSAWGNTEGSTLTFTIPWGWGHHLISFQSLALLLPLLTVPTWFLVFLHSWTLLSSVPWLFPL